VPQETGTIEPYEIESSDSVTAVWEVLET
jgi:hypothetical protein